MKAIAVTSLPDNKILFVCTDKISKVITLKEKEGATIVFSNGEVLTVKESEETILQLRLKPLIIGLE